MSLIKCNECGHSVSSKALSCPECGYPFNGQNELEREAAKNQERAHKPKQAMLEQKQRDWEEGCLRELEASRIKQLAEEKSKIRVELWKRYGWITVSVIIFVVLTLLLIVKMESPKYREASEVQAREARIDSYNREIMPQLQQLLAAKIKSPFEIVNVSSKSVEPNHDMVWTIMNMNDDFVGSYRDTYTKLSKTDQDEVLKDTKVKLVGLGNGEREVLEVDVEYSHFCSASGGICPSGIIERRGNNYVLLLNTTGVGSRYLSSKHNGMNDVVAFYADHAVLSSCTVYKYDGNRYTEASGEMEYIKSK